MSFVTIFIQQNLIGFDDTKMADFGYLFLNSQSSLSRNVHPID
jgi:hypothetical protein